MWVMSGVVVQIACLPPGVGVWVGVVCYAAGLRVILATDELSFITPRH